MVDPPALEEVKFLILLNKYLEKILRNILKTDNKINIKGGGEYTLDTRMLSNPDEGIIDYRKKMNKKCKN